VTLAFKRHFDVTLALLEAKVTSVSRRHCSEVKQTDVRKKWNIKHGCRRVPIGKERVAGDFVERRKRRGTEKRN